GLADEGGQGGGGGNGGGGGGGAPSGVREIRRDARVGDPPHRPAGDGPQGGGAMTRVAVLMGGWSAEREVSLSSGKECAKALKAEGYDVVAIDVPRDLDKLVKLLKPRPD